ncbi:MAG: methylmalonyl-CoA mutase subunit beta [Confluentibacter sp.]|nr:methylmalonyl-CoA mutase subunit beta [Confluentibacter sp.]HMR16190.1 methylmalonyl-CoA mutase subunit beta [Mariniflexile sp.]
MSDGLFDEFHPVTAKQWKQLIQFELKGADYNETLIWKTNEGILVRPFYTSEDFKPFPGPSSLNAHWRIGQTIFVADVKRSHSKAVKAIENGAESIKFVIPSEDVSIHILLENIDLKNTVIHFELQFLSEAFVKNIQTISSNTEIFIQTDIIGNLVRSGNWYHSLNADFAKCMHITAQTKTFYVDASIYQNAGANMVQQLAYAMAHATEYLDKMSDDDALYTMFKTTAGAQVSMVFNVSVGTNYFFEIAKLRALRLLWRTIANTYGINPHCHILALPSKRNKTIYESNTNLLRTTTECMSAIIGGADTIVNMPFDGLHKKSNTFSERLARNQLLILKHESWLSKVNNPADGAYYIETLTNQLAEKALVLFKDVEANGGFLKQLKEGTIQRKIKESAAKEQQQFETAETVLLGTNKFPNTKETLKNTLELYPFVKTKPRKTLIEPIIERRLAEKMEQARLKMEE